MVVQHVLYQDGGSGSSPGSGLSYTAEFCWKRSALFVLAEMSPHVNLTTSTKLSGGDMSADVGFDAGAYAQNSTRFGY